MSILLVACGLFSLGLYVVLSRRDLIGVLAGIEVMVGSAILLLVMTAAASAQGPRVHASALLILVLTACEAAVGLALLVAAWRRIGLSRIDEMVEVSD